MRSLNQVRANSLRHLLQRLEFLLIHQVELGDELVEVFVAGVDMRFSTWIRKNGSFRSF